jgi:hypothetical protein
MYSHYLFIALDTARQRADEADRERLAARSRVAVSRVNPVRRAVARVAVAVARVADEGSVRPAAQAH